MCLASHNNHPTSLASSWDISFLKSLVQQDPKGSNKVAHLFILDVYVSPNRKYVNLSIIYYILDFSFFMSQDDAYFHIHQNDPLASLLKQKPLGCERIEESNYISLQCKYFEGEITSSNTGKVRATHLIITEVPGQLGVGGLESLVLVEDCCSSCQKQRIKAAIWFHCHN